ncbi:hypothetical protein [Pedobacter insulae]|uniref:Uncharacterized protein n=1 Tax=Pedobacter insulae TaxID=414048 RepID=A0A1I3AF91_9SPHI|nr:hypothetical protein [Pedobacter insulae]SFH48600.1 hypothetical protein SAMN04489864_11456 [Pedobacter insulae]
MATIDKNTFDKLPKKIPGFVIYKSGDKYIIKLKPQKSSKPPSPLQIANRKRFAEMMLKRSKGEG